jgi:type IV pilus assembly protein PilQ
MRRLLLAITLAVPLLASPAAAQSAARHISVSFREADTRDVVRAFAEFSGNSVVVGSGVAGKITAEVRNQPWDTAMRTLLRAYGYDVREIAPGMLRVDPAAQIAASDAVAPLVSRAIRIRYIPAADVARVVTPMLSERGAVVASEAANAIVITDTEEVIARVIELIGHG